MNNLKRLYVVSLTILLCYNLTLSLHRVLVEEPTTFEETENQTRITNVPDLVPRNLEPEILSLRLGACDLVPKREI